MSVQPSPSPSPPDAGIPNTAEGLAAVLRNATAATAETQEILRHLTSGPPDSTIAVLAVTAIGLIAVITVILYCRRLKAQRFRAYRQTYRYSSLLAEREADTCDEDNVDDDDEVHLLESVLPPQSAVRFQTKPFPQTQMIRSNQNGVVRHSRSDSTSNEQPESPRQPPDSAPPPSEQTQHGHILDLNSEDDELIH